MANYNAKITNNAISGLNAQQAFIATVGNNIANVNTPGFSRRTVNLETRGTASREAGVSVGNGVEVASIVRTSDKYLEQVLRETISEKNGRQTEDDMLNRVQSLFDLTGDHSTIGSALNDFYKALNKLSQDPASLELRTNVIQAGTTLVSTIKTAYNTVADLQTEADQRIATEITSVNSITQGIAALNTSIASREAAGTEASDERDKRDTLLQKLAEKMSFSVTEISDGSINVNLPSGFSIVSGGTSRDLEVTNAPDFAAGSLPPSLGGQILKYIVYDYDSSSGTSHIDLTQEIKSGDGILGGLLAIRGYADPTNTSAFEADGKLVDIASRIEAITRTLLTTVNTTYLGPDEDSGTAGFQPSAGDRNGNVVSTVYGLFDFTYNGTKDANSDSLPNDLANPALGVDNFSSILTFGVSDPDLLAAALDGTAAGGATSYAPGDNQNIVALLNLLNSQSTISAGSFSLTGTFNDAYNELVTHVGNEKATTATDLNVANATFLSASQRRDEVSGVSLDEEFAQLITHQRAFQASARMIQVADKLLEQIVSLL